VEKFDSKPEIKRRKQRRSKKPKFEDINKGDALT